MKYDEKWEIIEKIGSGGQGTVYRVIDKTIKRETDNFIANYFNNTKGASVVQLQNELDKFFKLVHKRLTLEDVSTHRTLKLLHKPEESRDFQLAKERIKFELKAMKEVKHKNLINVIEYDDVENWFVADFYKNGSLDKSIEQFTGNVLHTFKSIRPLVEGVSILHKKKMVHRDIKPENIFIGADNQLILGDFGLIYFQDPAHNRISNTFSNVGSRDWMPGWAMGIKVDEVTSAFDVFSLGKVIWAMISGKSMLQLWYFKKDRNNLEKLFPELKEMKIVNKFLEKCIVEEEHDCIPNAVDLLNEIDITIEKLEMKVEDLELLGKRICKVCGKGHYSQIIKGNPTNFGLTATGARHFLIFECDYCGHIQLFSYYDEIPQAWKSTAN